MARRRTVMALAVLVSSGLSAVAWAAKQPTEVDSGGAVPPTPTERGTVIDDYRRWSRINPKPAHIPGPAAAACAAATTPGGVSMSPHLSRFITVYANAPARQPMLTQTRPRFPAGSVLVKEKKLAPGHRTPELLTAMEKKPAGFDPKHGDWEYSVWDGAGKRIDGGKVDHCQACHEKARATGYVFRDYLPSTFRRTLR